MKEYILFPGCLISFRFPHFESSAIKVLNRLNMELRQLDDVTCCPEPISMRILNLEAWYSIAARNICLAEQKSLDVLTLCNGCNQTLHRVNEDLKRDERLRMEVNEKLKEIGRRFEGKITVKSMLRVLYQDLGPNKIMNCLRRDLEGIKVAIHYGCHIFDELEAYDDPKNPKSLKVLVKALGADVVSYPSETLCCGAFARDIDKEFSLETAEEKLEELVKFDVDCLVVICPTCFFQYEWSQIELAKKFERSFRVPILYFTQLLGLAMGFGSHDMGLEYHRVKANKLIDML